jgi:Uma2 family endonuclease
MDYAIKKKRDGKFTVADYLAWADDERWELINGEAYDMTPAPTPRHQMIAGNLYSAIKTRMKKDTGCTIFIAPADVVLSDRDVVQPDVFVVCDRRKITIDHIQGVPDLVIEVLSPTTSTRDKRDKKALYERSGVQEYIIAYPDDLFIERYRLIAGKYAEPEIVGAEETLSLTLQEGMDIPLGEIFEAEPPKSLDTGRGNVV